MRNLKAKAESVVQDYLASRPASVITIVTRSSEFSDELCSEFELQPSPRLTRLGHPFELDDSRTTAFESLAATLLVDNLRQLFMKKHHRLQMPVDATDVFVEFAKKQYSKASRDTIYERIRLRKESIFSGGLGCFWQNDLIHESINRTGFIDQNFACELVSVKGYSKRRTNDCILVATLDKSGTQSIQVFSRRNLATD
jgi:hypothetical protein